MGTKMGPNCANHFWGLAHFVAHFVGFVKHQFFRQ